MITALNERQSLVSNTTVSMANFVYIVNHTSNVVTISHYVEANTANVRGTFDILPTDKMFLVKRDVDEIEATENIYATSVKVYG